MQSSKRLQALDETCQVLEFRLSAFDARKSAEARDANQKTFYSASVLKSSGDLPFFAFMLSRQAWNLMFLNPPASVLRTGC